MANPVLFVTDQDNASVWGYDSTLTQVTEIIGASTLLVPSFSIPLGCKVANSLVWLTDGGVPQVLAFNLTDNGNVAPTRKLVGGATTLIGPTDIDIGQITGKIHVA